MSPNINKVIIRQLIDNQMETIMPLQSEGHQIDLMINFYMDMQKKQDTREHNIVSF